MNSFYFWDEMAAKCLKSEQFQEAIQSYKHALESTDDNADQASVWANIGNIYLTIQDIPAAVDAFLAASRLDPNSYDLDCILERITANGYLNESAMILAKDMYALESVKIGLDGIVDIPDEISTMGKFPTVNDLDVFDQSLADASVAIEQDTIPLDIATPSTDVAVPESLAEPVPAENVAAIGESIIVETVSTEETSRPMDTTNEVKATNEAVPAEPIMQAELFSTVTEIEPAEPVSIEDASRSMADEAPSEVAAEVALTEAINEPEAPEIVAEISIPEPVVEEANSEVQAVIEALEPIAEISIPEPVAEEINSEVQVVTEVPEAVADVAVLESVAEGTNSEAQVVIEASEAATQVETPATVVGMVGMEKAPEPEPTEAYIEIPIGEILENPLHLRSSIQSEELVDSVRLHGILQPLVVTPMAGGKYMVVAGNRRLEAARLVGLELVPVVVRSAVERDFLELALIENIQRVNLDPLELAEAFHLLVENLGMSPETIAASIGKSCSVVTAALNLLKLTEEGKQALQEKSISEGHARALVAIDLPALQNNALVYVLENRLGVRQTEDLVRIILNAVAVSRSYDESYHEEIVTEAPLQETASVECADEIVLEAPEIESVTETEPLQTEPDPIADTAVEPEVTEAIVEATVANPEPVLIEVASITDAGTNQDAVSVDEQQDVMVVTEETVIDLLVAESEKAEAFVEKNSTENAVDQTVTEIVLEDEAADFYWIKPEAEAANQAQQDGIGSPASVEPSREETFEEVATPVSIPTESIFAVTDGDATRDMAIQTEVTVADSALAPAPETAFQKTEENLADVIEEIVQFTAEGNSPFSETQAETCTDQTLISPELVPQLDCLETVEQKDPDGPETRTQLKGLEAISVYRRVVENNPGNVRIWHLLGNLYSDMGQYEEAIDCLKRTIELDPGKYTYYYHLGLTLAIARRYPEAIQALEKTIELAPQHILAHCSLAGCYRRIDNETEAQKHIEIAKPKLTQEKAYNRACFESISGNSDQAIELLQIALSTDKTPVEWLLRDPDLDFIRDDPRFQAMVAELTLPV